MHAEGQIRHKLQETDKDWHEAAAAAPVTSRNLPPGSHHFSVAASDTNGVWSGAPANMAFTYCRLSTRPPGSACCAWLRFWHSFGACIISECGNCGGRTENVAKPLRAFRRWRGSVDLVIPFNF